jgi:hypothetical protein
LVGHKVQQELFFEGLETIKFQAFKI